MHAEREKCATMSNFPMSYVKIFLINTGRAKEQRKIIMIASKHKLEPKWRRVDAGESLRMASLLYFLKIDG